MKKRPAKSEQAADPDYEQQRRKLTELLEEGIADLEAGRVFSAEEVERRLDERLAAKRARKAGRK